MHVPFTQWCNCVSFVLVTILQGNFWLAFLTSSEQAHTPQQSQNTPIPVIRNISHIEQYHGWTTTDQVLVVLNYLLDKLLTFEANLMVLQLWVFEESLTGIFESTLSFLIKKRPTQHITIPVMIMGMFMGGIRSVNSHIVLLFVSEFINLLYIVIMNTTTLSY